MKTDALWLTGLIIFGFMLGQLTAVYRTRRDFWLLDSLTRAQLDSAERQLAQRLAADELRRLVERKERAYAELSRWLAELQSTVDEVCHLGFSTEPIASKRGMAILEAWPWETLRVPSYASWGDLHWSDEVRSEIHRFGEVSGNFAIKGYAYFKRRDEGSAPEKLRDQKSQLVNDARELADVIGSIKSRASADLSRIDLLKK